MTDALERIWLQRYRSDWSPHPRDKTSRYIADANSAKSEDDYVEYVRADILAQTLAANAALMVRLHEAQKVLSVLLELNDNHAPFGGEIYHDRIDRAWDNARAYLAGKDASHE